MLVQFYYLGLQQRRYSDVPLYPNRQNAPGKALQKNAKQQQWYAVRHQTLRTWTAESPICLESLRGEAGQTTVQSPSVNYCPLKTVIHIAKKMC